jgi:iron complex transport system substrate-binding protein
MLPALALAAIEVPQADGSILTLEQPATRIIALAPNIAETLFAAGAGDLLLATAEYSDYPPQAAQLPRIGDAFRFDLERILDYRPDLVIGWQSGNPATALAGLERLGLKLWRTEVSTPDDIARLLEQVGQVTGRQDSAQAAAQAFREQLEQLRASHQDKAPLRYFYQVDERPLYTVNGQHLISQGIDTCGARNVFDELPSLAPQVSLESVLAADPDVIFAPAIAGQDAALDRWQDWPRLQAVQTGALLWLPADQISQATPRLLEAVAVACEQLDGLRDRLAAQQEQSE